MVIDADMHKFPARTARFALLRVAGDAVPGAAELAEFLDVDVDKLAGGVAFVSCDRCSWIQIAPTVETMMGFGCC